MDKITERLERLEARQEAIAFPQWLAALCVGVAGLVVLSIFVMLMLSVSMLLSIREDTRKIERELRVLQQTYWEDPTGRVHEQRRQGRKNDPQQRHEGGD